ncbi:response regulator transcription factor [Nitrosopumilus sp.]|uniref:response regulator transcription factor n=1 Tax=Nitrosopumilus sp. TaxID=2024843 RepID=UPI003D0EFE81
MTIRALVVDDDQNVLNTFVDLLEICKINVAGTAKNGKEAIEQFKKINPDLVFLDIMMPEFDGRYALREIRTVHQDIPVVMISGGDDDAIDPLLEFNPSAVLHKPFRMSTLLELLKNELKLELDSD